jgi:hypothetical protein
LTLSSASSIGTENGNSSSMSALPVLAVETIRSSPGMRPRYFSCSTTISFSTSCGAAPGHWC